MVRDTLELNVDVRHWRFETGEPEFVGKSKIHPTGYRSSLPRGWYCWAYPTDNRLFESWMDRNCPKSEYQLRFNGGDPMYTVQIIDDRESFLFQLAWLK